MQQIKREALKEGMCFSAPVFFDDGVNMFLAEKSPLSKFHLNVLVRWNVPFVTTYGKELSSASAVSAAAEEAEDLEELEELEEASAPSFSILASVRKSLTASPLWQYYTMAMKNMECVYESYRDQSAIDKTLLEQSVNLIHQLVKEDKNFALYCVFCKFDTAAYYPASTVNTAVLGAVLAMDLDFPDRTVMYLITAGLVRDLEMFKVPESSFSKSADGFNSVNPELVKVHPLKISKFISDVLGYPREVSVIIMQHHEHWDGSGYPEGRKGENIDPCARILHVCDAFYTMISKKPHGKEMICYDAVKALLDAKEKLFGPNALKAFIHSVGLYPPGTFVILKDGRIAQVVVNHPDYPFAPAVRIFSTDANGRLTDPDIAKVPVVDLNVDKSVFIIRAVDAEAQKTDAAH